MRLAHLAYRFSFGCWRVATICTLAATNFVWSIVESERSFREIERAMEKAGKDGQDEAGKP